MHIVCGLIPVIGSLLGGLIGAAASALASALIAAFLVQRWFALRKEAGDSDAEGAARQALNQVTGPDES